MLVNFSNISPMPVALDPATPLYSIVFHVYLKINRTFDGTDIPPTAIQTFDGWAQVLNEGDPPFLQIQIPDTSSLLQGWYSVLVDGSISTNDETLVNLPGRDTYPDGTPYAQSIKFSGVTLNDTPPFIPVQFVKSTLTLCDTDCPDNTTIPEGAVTFHFDETGYGKTTCFVDGRRVVQTALGPTSQCESPIGISLNDTETHTLEVLYTDVCGVTRSKWIDFNTLGWQFNRTSDPPAPPPPAPMPPSPPYTAPPPYPPFANRTAGAAGTSVPSAIVTLFLAAVAAAVL
jgi:hypothetical protein